MGSFVKAKEIFQQLTDTEQGFVLRFFKENKKPNRWRYATQVGIFVHKWQMLKGFDSFKDLSPEEFEQLKNKEVS